MILEQLFCYLCCLAVGLPKQFGLCGESNARDRLQKILVHHDEELLRFDCSDHTRHIMRRRRFINGRLDISRWVSLRFRRLRQSYHCLEHLHVRGAENGIFISPLFLFCFLLSRSMDHNLHFSIFDLFSCIDVRISFWVSFPRCWPLKRCVFIAGTEIIVPYFLLDITADHFFSSRVTGRYSFLDCILHRQSHKRFKFSREMELLLVQMLQYVFIEMFCDGEKYFVPLGVDTLHVVILQLYSEVDR